MKIHLKPRTATAIMNSIKPELGMSVSISNGGMDMFRKPKTLIVRIVIDGDNGEKAKQVFDSAWAALYSRSTRQPNV
jgi:hypothetical protein